MATAVIVDAVRTALGKRNGKLKDWHPVDLAAETLKSLVQRNDLDPGLVEDVIMGCVMQTGEQGRFGKESIPITVETEEGKEEFARDQGIRPDSSMESLANLKPAFKPDGKVTAGNSSQITDGAAALLIMSEEKAKALGLTPRARFHSFALAGVDPIMMLTGPIPATSTVLERAGMTMEQMDLTEINEAFASVGLAWEKEHQPGTEEVHGNVG